MSYFVEDLVALMFMRPEKVVVSYPESKIIACAIDAVKAVCLTVRSLISTVEPFDHLLEGTVIRGDSIIVGKADYLGDLESKRFPKLFCELHSGKGIGAVAICNEFKVFRKLF